jgi:SAM-dependent methyltransferase
MANNHRKGWRVILPTAHKLILNRNIKKDLMRHSENVLVIGAGEEPYMKLLKNSKKITLSDAHPISKEYVQADAHNLPFESDCYDYVIAKEVFEHLERPELAVKEINRVLKEGGECLITIPFMFRIHGDPLDFQRYTIFGIKKLFESFGNIEIAPFGSRMAVISDIVTTSSKALVPLRFLNWIITLSFLGTSKDSPSGYIVRLKK